MNLSLTAKLKKIYFFPNISTTRVIIDILFGFFFLLQNDVVRHCLFWFHLLHCCGLYIHVFFTKSCLHIHHNCEVCFCSVLYTRHRFVVKSKHVLFVLYFIHLFLHFTPDPEKTVPSVCLCVCLSVVWTDSFSIGKYSRNPLYNTTDPFSTKLVTSYPWVQGSHFFFFLIGYTLIKWPISYQTFVFVRNIKTVIIMIFSSKHLEVNIMEQRRGQSVAIVTGLYMYEEWFLFSFFIQQKVGSGL